MIFNIFIILSDSEMDSWWVTYEMSIGYMIITKKNGKIDWEMQLSVWKTQEMTKNLIEFKWKYIH